MSSSPTSAGAASATASASAAAARAAIMQYARGTGGGIGGGGGSGSAENLPPRTLARLARQVRDLHKSPPEGVRLVVDGDSGLPSNLGELMVRESRKKSNPLSNIVLSLASAVGFHHRGVLSFEVFSFSAATLRRRRIFNIYVFQIRSRVR